MKNPTAPCLLALFVILGSAGNSQGQDNASDPGCPREKLAGARDRGRDGEALYRMGQQIKKFVRNKDLAGLLSLSERGGELPHGPRKIIAKSRNFDEVFSTNWRDSVLEDEIPCAPVNHYVKVNLGGSILYSEYGVFAIFGARNEATQRPLRSVGWKIREGIVPPRCLGFGNFRDRKYESLDRCLNEYTGAVRQPDIKWPAALADVEFQSLGEEDWVVSRLPEDEDGVPCCKFHSGSDCSSFCPVYAYRILRGVPAERCRKLAPDTPGKCAEAYLIAEAQWSGGKIRRFSEGWAVSYAIHGLFSGIDGKRKIAFLKEFSTENDALNYVDSHSAGSGHGQVEQTTFCTFSDRKYARKVGYHPEELCSFARAIKTLVRNKNLKGLFSLVEGELEEGPRKRFVRENKFDDIFSAAWRRNILESELNWTPRFGSGKTFLGGERDSIWFSGPAGREMDSIVDFVRRFSLGGRAGGPPDGGYAGWKIEAIYGASKEDYPAPPMPAGWRTREGLIPPACFFPHLMGSDTARIDLCFKGTIFDEWGEALTQTDPELIQNSWDSWDGGSWIKSKICSGENCEIPGTPSYYSGARYYYSVLGQIPIERCQAFVAGSSIACRESFLVATVHDDSGSIGPMSGYQVFGLFVSAERKRHIGRPKYMVPLKGFRTKNDALNYLDLVRK